MVAATDGERGHDGIPDIDSTGRNDPAPSPLDRRGLLSSSSRGCGTDEACATGRPPTHHVWSHPDTLYLIESVASCALFVHLVTSRPHHREPKIREIYPQYAKYTLWPAVICGRWGIRTVDFCRV